MIHPHGDVIIILLSIIRADAVADWSKALLKRASPDEKATDAFTADKVKAKFDDLSGSIVSA